MTETAWSNTVSVSVGTGGGGGGGGGGGITTPSIDWKMLLLMGGVGLTLAVLAALVVAKK